MNFDGMTTLPEHRRAVLRYEMEKRLGAPLDTPLVTLREAARWAHEWEASHVWIAVPYPTQTEV